AMSAPYSGSTGSPAQKVAIRTRNSGDADGVGSRGLERIAPTRARIPAAVASSAPPGSPRRKKRRGAPRPVPHPAPVRGGGGLSSTARLASSSASARSIASGAGSRVVGRRREVLVAELERGAHAVPGALLDEVELVLFEAQIRRERVHEEAGGLLADVALRLL